MAPVEPGRAGLTLPASGDASSKAVVVGVGHLAFDVLRYRLPAGVCRSVWRVSMIAHRRPDDGKPVDLSIHVTPPEPGTPGSMDPWEACRSTGLPAFGVARLLQTADVIVVLGGLDPLTHMLLRDLGPLSALRVFFCLTRRSTGQRSLIRWQRERLRSLSGFVDTTLELPVTPSADESLNEEPPIESDKETVRLVGQCVGSLCSAVAAGRSASSRTRSLFVSGKMGGVAVGSCRRSEGIGALVRAALADRPIVSGGFRLDRARRVWLCIGGGVEDAVERCLDELARSGTDLLRKRGLVTVAAPGRALSLTVIAFGFGKPSARPTAFPSGVEQGEARARSLLQRILPDQAARYDTEGFIEIASKLHEGRTYRIHDRPGFFATDLHHHGKEVGAMCIDFLDPFLPRTDRVLAEYLTISGDESRYLEEANFRPPQPATRTRRAEILERHLEEATRPLRGLIEQSP